jgi:hypothetical protein
MWWVVENTNMDPSFKKSWEVLGVGFSVRGAGRWLAS